MKERKPPSRTFSLRPVGGRERGSTPVRSSSFNMHASINALNPRGDNNSISKSNHSNQNSYRGSDTDGETSETHSIQENVIETTSIDGSVQSRVRCSIDEDMSDNNSICSNGRIKNR